MPTGTCKLPQPHPVSPLSRLTYRRLSPAAGSPGEPLQLKQHLSRGGRPLPQAPWHLQWPLPLPAISTELAGERHGSRGHRRLLLPLRWTSTAFPLRKTASVSRTPPPCCPLCALRGFGCCNRPVVHEYSFTSRCRRLSPSSVAVVTSSGTKVKRTVRGYNSRSVTASVMSESIADGTFAYSRTMERSGTRTMETINSDEIEEESVSSYSSLYNGSGEGCGRRRGGGRGGGRER